MKANAKDAMLLNIIAAYLRLTRSGIDPKDVPVKMIMKQYGFLRVRNEKKKSEALFKTYQWICYERFASGTSPAPSQMVAYLKKIW